MTEGSPESGEVVFVRHTPMRRRIAERMVASQAESAHAYALLDVDYTVVDAARREFGGAWRESHGYALTFLPFIARAVVLSIGRNARLNSRFTDKGLEIPTDINLGIAVDLDSEGLMVPVVAGAGTASISVLAESIRDLADRARKGALTANDVAGGTFTLSNPGPFGARQTFPIINQPQVAIITVDSIEMHPAVVQQSDGSSAIAPRLIGNLTLAWDHRAFDGAYAITGLKDVKTTLESHDWRAELAAESATWQDDIDMSANPLGSAGSSNEEN